MSAWRPLPEPGEARALADALRDMMASGLVDQAVLRRAANALQAVADGLFRIALPRIGLAALVEAEPDGGPDPLGAFEEPQPSRQGDAP